MSTVIPLPSPRGTRERFASEVRAQLGRHNKTQTDLALVLGVSQSQMSKRLRGVIPFDIDEIQTVASYFGVRVGSLFGEAGITRPDGPDGGGLGLGSVDPEPTQENVRPRLLVAA